MKKKNLIVFGTRPEAIKMAPLVKAFLNEDCFDTKVCVTAQHREMLDQVLDFFEITPDYDLDVMKPNQNLYSLTATIIEGMKPVLEEVQPDYVYVHGDTTTSMAVGIAGFYAGAKVCHVEAGLRTYDRQYPFPEEFNRQLTGRIADYHFAPTKGSKENLLQERTDEKSILVTGNTVIDALLFGIDKVTSTGYSDAEIEMLTSKVDLSKKIILVTGHRRENHGEGLMNICTALKNVAEAYPNTQIIYPVHLNPNVKGPVHELLAGVANILLVPPLAYPAFIWLMEKSYLIITDSGGIQEEAPSLGKPVLVTRTTTERPEAVAEGTVLLVGTDIEEITSKTKQLLDDETYYASMSELHNPYGDGKSVARIVDFIKAL
ncbi:MAG TPA: UDP-N-acetylglucosamine 2-epimerase (non-hydrolyzing) [Flavobacteriaceae bacterium]|jgi:UDP-N-acetylglucosamine 2-epimerase (non-hydrolysing)|nr:UDP-N-acetylglucosamine 2-epimerase (non-hydrolyzing) [Flavobacteriaceae bacterium]MAY53012.1 UDP-N-acetylglucosamine 2-epimerase (non-hydrolyzing) [Flavobacteriaceae bacterium]HBR53309.1 UDP-N-acetylglucosamine 2-epimerase (non-hydrolyzing) [Flavobacteriaceae bacterium]|tara:strand:- start:179672 stop:180796 length:1125 start_codon:yes stop_codon:yes gene_type:complete